MSCAACTASGVCMCYRPRGGNTEQPARQGWECPRCRVVNAPWVVHCDCQMSYPLAPTWGMKP